MSAPFGDPCPPGLTLGIAGLDCPFVAAARATETKGQAKGGGTSSCRVAMGPIRMAGWPSVGLTFGLRLPVSSGTAPSSTLAAWYSASRSPSSCKRRWDLSRALQCRWANRLHYEDRCFISEKNLKKSSPAPSFRCASIAGGIVDAAVCALSLSQSRTGIESYLKPYKFALMTHSSKSFIYDITFTCTWCWAPIQ